jgi:hypothetical protein
MRGHVPLTMVNPHYRDGGNVRCTFPPLPHIAWGVGMCNIHFVGVSKWMMHVSGGYDEERCMATYVA